VACRTTITLTKWVAGQKQQGLTVRRKPLTANRSCGGPQTSPDALVSCRVASAQRAARRILRANRGLPALCAPSSLSGQSRPNFRPHALRLQSARQPPATARAERRLAAIVSADVAGFSRLMGQDESGTFVVLKGLPRQAYQSEDCRSKRATRKILAQSECMVEALGHRNPELKSVPAARSQSMPSRREISACSAPDTRHASSNGHRAEAMLPIGLSWGVVVIVAVAALSGVR
jgi:hypothetical protein